MQFALILLIGHFGFYSCAHSAELAEVAPPSENSGSNLAAKALALIKTAMKVLKEDEGVVSLTHPGHSYAVKTQILFFRKRGSRIEMIATGVFNSEKLDAKSGKNEILTDLDRDNIIKYPHAGDYAVPMTDPNLAALDGKDGNEFPPPAEEKPKEDDSRPGYFEVGMGMMFGNINTNTTSIANTAKITSNYRFQLIHVAYYSEYVPIGIEYDSYKGKFPTKTFQLTVVESSENISNLSFNYRFKPLLNRHLAFTAKVNSLSDTFTTNSVDNSLLSTKITGLGFGLRAGLDIVSPAWVKQPNEFFIQVQGFYGEYLFYPMINANDTGGISRGTSSSGSTASQYRVGATVLAWISFIPIVKRWVASGSYGMRAYSLKFSGTPVGEVGNPQNIATGGTSKESESDYRFFVGFRLDDPIKMLFGNDDKKEK